MPVLKRIHPNIDDDIFNGFSKTKYDATQLRSITYDFVSILRSDEIIIGSKIYHYCVKNYDNFGSVCYCCGKKVNIKKANKQCDHLVPIINMMLYIKLSETTSSGKLKNLLSNNLHYIHVSCNNKKGNCSLQELWRNCGTDFYGNKALSIGGTSINTSYSDVDHVPLSIYRETLGLNFNKQQYLKLLCREKIARILRNISIHRSVDINQRMNALTNLNKKIVGIKEDAKLYFSNTNAANLLINVSKMKN